VPLFDGSSLSLEVLNEAVIAIDSEGRIVYFNPSAEELLGYDREEMLGISSRTLLAEDPHSERVASGQRFFTEAPTATRDQVRKVFFRHKDGRDLHLECHIRRVDTAQGPIAVGTLKDLRESDEHEREFRGKLEALEERLAQRTLEFDADIDELEAVSYAVFHDLQAPLRAMQVYAQVLLDEEGKTLSKPVAEFMKQVVDAVTRMESLAQRVLDYRHVLRSELVMHPIDVQESFKDVLAYLEAVIQAANASVTTTGGKVMALADHATMFEVLANLITNAIKFGKPGQAPHIALGVVAAGQFVLISVEDDGIGIEAKDRQRIFRMFERVYSPGQPPGSGIGLAIVKHGVERMNGRVGVESRPGKGSRFWVELPAV
jgi:PAS domain S-box-containing protein